MKEESCERFSVYKGDDSNIQMKEQLQTRVAM